MPNMIDEMTQMASAALLDKVLAANPHATDDQIAEYIATRLADIVEDIARRADNGDAWAADFMSRLTACL